MEEFIEYLNEVEIPIKKIVDEYWKKLNEVNDNYGRNLYGLMTPKQQSAIWDYEAIEILKSLAINSNSLEELEEIIKSSQDENIEQRIYNIGYEYIENYKKTKETEKKR